MESTEQQYYGINECAAILGIHHQTVRTRIKTKEIPARRVGNQWRIPKSFLDAQRCEGDAKTIELKPDSVFVKGGDLKAHTAYMGEYMEDGGTIHEIQVSPDGEHQSGMLYCIYRVPAVKIINSTGNICHVTGNDSRDIPLTPKKIISKKELLRSVEEVRIYSEELLM